MCLRGVPHFSHTLKFRSHPKADGKVDVARRKVGKGGLRETRLKIYTIRRLHGVPELFPRLVSAATLLALGHNAKSNMILLTIENHAECLRQNYIQ